MVLQRICGARSSLQPITKRKEKNRSLQGNYQEREWKKLSFFAIVFVYIQRVKRVCEAISIMTTPVCVTNFQPSTVHKGEGFSKDLNEELGPLEIPEEHRLSHLIPNP